MLKRFIHLVFKTLSPIRYARFIGVRVGDGCRLINVKYSSEPYLISIGNHVSATSTRFETHDGGVWVFRTTNPGVDVVKPIKIGDNVFIGFGCIILPGVTVGDNVVIGAHSVVSKDIPPNCVVAGVPARVIKDLQSYKNKILFDSHDTKYMSKNEKRAYYCNEFSI
ncbi:acyltransferase [Algoriphagus sp. PAP.12]|uniref:acyltransferase n=1 Tax=Algoriphagus sp. PAP.12 TaxID=2996678 RepID=UPI00227C53F6|nr:acyltransferase [Algoriphagus sp. PAP.12]